MYQYDHCLYPAGHEIYNFGRPSLAQYYFKISLYDMCSAAEKKILKE